MEMRSRRGGSFGVGQRRSSASSLKIGSAVRMVTISLNDTLDIFQRMFGLSQVSALTYSTSDHPAYPVSRPQITPSFCWHNLQDISWIMRPRRRSMSDVWGICLRSEETEMRWRLTLCHAAAMEYELDNLAHSFSSTASELEQRRHWVKIAGLVRLARSILYNATRRQRRIQRSRGIHIACDESAVRPNQHAKPHWAIDKAVRNYVILRVMFEHVV